MFQINNHTAKYLIKITINLDQISIMKKIQVKVINHKTEIKMTEIQEKIIITTKVVIG
jgi:hypothetical protein